MSKVPATCKHYAGYDLDSWNGYSRYGFQANITRQELVEYYLPPFQQCVRDSQVSAIMCSYNLVNDTPTCTNSYLIEQILRQHWNWTATHHHVVSDCDVVNETVARTRHKLTLAEFSALMFNRGTDLICAGDSQADVSAAYDRSLLSKQRMEVALRRRYEALVCAGYFGPNATDPYASLGWSAVNTVASQALARRSAAESMVLIKNDGTLPLSMPNDTRTALIGPYANATWQLLGSYLGVPPYYHNPLYYAKQLGLKTFYASGPSIFERHYGKLNCAN